MILVFLTFTSLTACHPSSEKLFASQCENENENCKDPVVRLSTSGARTELTDAPIENGEQLADPVLLEPVESGETTEVEFSIRNVGLTPLRQFTLENLPASLSIDNSAPDACANTLVLLYDSTCKVKVTFAPGAVFPDHPLTFNFISLLGDTVSFEATLGGAEILAGFDIAESTTFEAQEVVFHSAYTVTPFYEKEFTISNPGSHDSLSGIKFFIMGSGSQHYEVVSGGAGACTAGQTLAANGGSCKLTVRFRPVTEGFKSAILSFFANGGYQDSFDLSGTAIALQASEGTIDFAAHSAADGPVEKTFQINHPGQMSDATARTCNFTVAGPNFELANNTCASPMSPGTSCDVTVRFTPQATSTFHSGSLQFDCDERGGSRTIDLIGQSVVSDLIPNKTILDFGSVLIGSTATSTLTLTNTSGSTLTDLIGTFDEMVGDGITISSTTCGEELTAGASCDVIFAYAPTAAGTANGSYNAVANESEMENPVAITGRSLSIYASETNLDFGTVTPSGTEVGPVIWITNPSFYENATACLIDTSGLEDQGFSLAETSTCTTVTTLGPGESCSVQPQFDAPESSGTATATFSYSCGVGGMAEVNLKAETSAETRLMTLIPTSLNFENRLVGIAATGSFSIMNSHASDPANNIDISTSGVAAPWSALTGDPTDCSNFTNLLPGESCNVRLQYWPSATFGSEEIGTSGGSIPVSADSGAIDPADPTYSATAVKILASVASVDFGTVSTNQATLSDIVIIENPSNFDMASGCTLDASPEFEVEPMTCGTTIAASDSCFFRLQLKAQAVSMNVTGYARMDCTVGGRAQVNLMAAIKHPPTLQWAGDADFGNVDIGQSKTNVFTLSHTGATLDAATTALAISLLTGTAGFELINPQPSPHGCPAVLQPAQSCTVQVRFTPTNTTPATDTLRASDPKATADLVLNGVGVDTSLRVVANPTSVEFNDRLVGIEVFSDITLTNQATAGAATDLSVGAPSTGLPWSLGTSSSVCGTSLALSATCDVRLEYKPTDVGTTTGTVTVTASNMTPARVIDYTGTAKKILASVNMLDFAAVDVNTEKTLPSSVIITNPSAVDAADTCNLSITGSDFELVGSTCGTSIATSSSCGFGVKFKGSATIGTYTSQAIMTCAIGGTATVNLEVDVYDLPDIVITPVTTADFGEWDIDAGPKTLDFTVQNTGVSAASLTDVNLRVPAGNFSIDPAGTTCAAPQTLSAGTSCTVRVAFDPTTETVNTGGESATLYVSIDNPAPHDYELELTGAGTTMNLIASTNTVQFADREVGQTGSETITVTLTNTGSRTASLQYTSLNSPMSVGGTCGATLAPGANCTLDFSIVAAAAPAVHTANFVVSEAQSSAAKNVEIALAGETVGGAVFEIRDDLDNTTFAPVISLSDVTGEPNGPRSIMDLTPTSRDVIYELKNTATAPAADLVISGVTLNQIAAGGGIDNTMAVAADTCTGATLAPEQTCSITVRYTPLSSSEFSIYEMAVNATSSISGAMHTASVTNIEGWSRKSVDLLLSESTFTFSAILNSDSSNTHTVTLTNQGDVSAKNLAFNFVGANPSQFDVVEAASTCIAGGELGGGQSCTIALQFIPGNTTGVFVANLGVSETQSGDSTSIALTGPSYHNDILTADNQGFESSAVADSDRLYIVSRTTLDPNASPDKYRPLLTVCSRDTAGVALLNNSNCTQTDVVPDILGGTTDSNFAGSYAASGPRITQYGSKLFVGLTNKSELAEFGGDPTGGTATIMICEKPTIGNAVTDCAYDVVNSGVQTGYFPSLVVTSDRIFISNTGPSPGNQLIMTSCSYDGTQTLASVLDPANCVNYTFPETNGGWYTSAAYDGGRMIVATTDISSTGNERLRINICDWNSGLNQFENCSSNYTGVSEINEGFYPSLVVNGSKMYVAHTKANALTTVNLRLTTCDLSGSSFSGCFAQTVSKVAGQGFYPHLSMSASNLWISSSFRYKNVDPAASSFAMALEIHQCPLPVSASSCSGIDPYVRQSSSFSRFPLPARSHYLDTDKNLLFVPFKATTTAAPIYNGTLGLMQIGLAPEI